MSASAITQDGKYTEAVDAYNRVITNYPKGDRAPDANYKRGMAFERLGQADRARESFESLMKNFPDQRHGADGQAAARSTEQRQAARLEPAPAQRDT